MSNYKRLFLLAWAGLISVALAQAPSMRISYNNDLQPDHAATKVEVISTLSPPEVISREDGADGSLRFFTTKGTLSYSLSDSILNLEAGSIVLWLSLPAGVEYKGFPRILDVSCKEGFMFIGLGAEKNWLYAAYGDNKDLCLAKIADIPQDGNWHQVAITWSNQDGLFKAYMDGKPVRQVPLKGKIVQPEQLFVGTDKRGNNRINMLLDELTVYDQVLSPDKIEEMYLNTLPKKKVRRSQSPPRPGT